VIFSDDETSPCSWGLARVFSWVLCFSLAPAGAGASLASEIGFQWKSPAFSGVGYSSHVLTIENQERVRQKQSEDRRSACPAEPDTAGFGLPAFCRFFRQFPGGAGVRMLRTMPTAIGDPRRRRHLAEPACILR
jgi:hypothetical protein